MRQDILKIDAALFDFLIRLTNVSHLYHKVLHGVHFGGNCSLLAYAHSCWRHSCLLVRLPYSILRFIRLVASRGMNNGQPFLLAIQLMPSLVLQKTSALYALLAIGASYLVIFIPLERIADIEAQRVSRLSCDIYSYPWY